MDQGVGVRGTVLSDPEIAVLDRVIPRVVGAFDSVARQRILAGLALEEQDPSPGYALLARRLLSCARAPAPPVEAGMRRVMRERVVTFRDVERVMEQVARSAGPDDVSDAIDRLQAESALGPDENTALDQEPDGAAPDILGICLANLGSPFGLPGFRDAAEAELDLDFGNIDVDPFEIEASSERAGTHLSGRPSARIESLWDIALRAELDAGQAPLSGLSGSMRVAVIIGYRGDPKALCQAVGATLAGSTQQPVLGLVLVDEESLLKSKNHASPAKIDALVRSLLEEGNGVIFNAAGGSLPPFVESVAERRVALASCHGALLRVVETLAEDGAVLRRVRGGAFLPWLRDHVSSVPFARANAVRAWLRQAYEAGHVDAAAEDVLLRLAQLRLVTPAPRRSGPETLDAVRGLEPGVRRRLRRIADRMRTPEGGRVGLLLSGPPGTGKTMIAGLLARESGRHFVQGSLSEWQSSGYLNDFLSAMRGAFDEARRNAPSVIFIDEADSIGQRGATGNRNDDYWNMVVNSMLECLQGLGDRGDVTVVAASNHPELIDPAIRREGRIGETIEIPLPSRAGRAEILAALLPEAGGAGFDLQGLADRTGPCSPAALEGLAREARLLASESGETLAPAHLDAALREAAGPDAFGRALPALAIGLAGEALMLRAAYGDEARILGLSVEPGLADRGRVTVDYAGGRRPSGTAADSLRALHLALAPAAARALAATARARPGLDALDCFSNLAAGEQIAAREQALAHVDSGALSAAGGPDLARREELARRATAEAWRQVTRVLALRRAALDRLADLLVTRHRIDGDAFARLADGNDLPTLH